jgi:hypothetical protein
MELASTTLACQEPVFATSQNKKVYHITKGKNETLCGLRILPIVFSAPTGSALHLVQSRPENLVLCKHCARIEHETDSSDSVESEALLK